MNDIHNETWDMLFNLSGTNKSKTRKRTKRTYLSAPFYPQRSFLDGDTALESDLSTSGFGVGAEVILLFVRFLERGDDKFRDREAFG